MALVFRNGQWVQDDVDVESYRRRMQNPEVRRIYNRMGTQGRQPVRSSQPMRKPDTTPMRGDSIRLDSVQDYSSELDKSQAQALMNALIAQERQRLAGADIRALGSSEGQVPPATITPTRSDIDIRALVAHELRRRAGADIRALGSSEGRVPYTVTYDAPAVVPPTRSGADIRAFGTTEGYVPQVNATAYTGPAVAPPTRSGADILAFGAADASPTSIAPDIPANDVRALAAQDLIGTDIAIDPLTMGSDDFGNYIMPTQAEMQDWADTSSDLMAAQSMMLLPGLLTAGRGGVEVLGPEVATAGGYAQLPAGASRLALAGNAARTPISGGGAAALPAPAVAPSAAIRMPYTGSGPAIPLPRVALSDAAPAVTSPSYTNFTETMSNLPRWWNSRYLAGY